MRFLTILKFLMVIALPFLVILIVLNFVGFDGVFYQQKFREYGVEQNVQDPGTLHEKVIDFLKEKSDELPNDFNEREMQHLFDVRNIVRISTIALYAFLILFVLLLIVSSFILKVNNKIINFVGKVLIFGGFLTVVLAIFLFLSIRYDFASAFESFHNVFFEKGTYSFDPTKEIIVKLYPEQLFMELGIRISLWVIISAVVVILIGAMLLFRPKNKKNKNRCRLFVLNLH